MKKLLATMMAVLMAATMLVGCGGSEEAAAPAEEAAAVEETAEESTEATGEMVNIGVIQFMQHGSLDENYKGFVDGLAEAGYVEGENLTINFQNASGEVANCQQICELFANSDTDLVFAIATPAAQSAVNVFQETEIPVLFSSVTDAVGAGLVDSNEAPGKNVTGTLDMPVIADQIAVIKDVLPEAQKVAILYTSSEANSEIQAEEAKAAAEAKRAKYSGRVFQDPLRGTAGDMWIEENLAFALRRGKRRSFKWGISNKEREQFVELLKTLDLGLENRLSAKVGLLSGGQRQALTLLMATIQKPQLLLLDEHTAALDPHTAKKVLDITNKVVTENNLTTLMITHNMKDAIKYGNRLIMMQDGRIIYDVAGEEKKNLKVSDLLVKFEEASGGEFANDRMMLAR